jgi:hypothetical protein
MSFPPSTRRWPSSALSGATKDLSMTTKTHNGMTKRFVFGSEWNFMPEGRKSVNQRFEEELEAKNLVCCLLPVLISTFMHFGLSPYFIFILYSGLGTCTNNLEVRRKALCTTAMVADIATAIIIITGANIASGNCITS